jgi:riboflavin synthase
MFTGIIKATGTVKSIKREGSNIELGIESSISKELHEDQSVCHDGVCLTVTRTEGDQHFVTLIDESLKRSAFKNVEEGELINLECSMRMEDLLDGHMVQGHVDGVGTVKEVTSADGSFIFTIGYDSKNSHLIVDKGSVSLNGVSLTVVEPTTDTFKVAIIPFTMDHTNFKNLKPGDLVNLEFDILGKYVAKILANRV